MMEEKLAFFRLKNVSATASRDRWKKRSEYYLNEQMKAIQRELGDSEDGKSELDELGEQINKAGLPRSSKKPRLS